MEKLTIAVMDYSTAELDIYRNVLCDDNTPFDEWIENWLTKNYGSTSSLNWMCSYGEMKVNEINA